jgi:hypothetical protein
MARKCLLCGAEKGKPRKVIHKIVENKYEFDISEAVKVLGEIREACQRAEVLIKELRNARAEVYQARGEL